MLLPGHGTQIYLYMFPVPGSVAPPMVPRPFPNCFHLHAICSISEPQPFTCNLCAAFQSRILPYKISRCYLCTTCMLSTYYLYIIHVHMYFSHLYTTNSVSINYSYVILLSYITLCTPVCNLYTTHSVLPLSYSSTTDKLHQPPIPPPPTPQGEGGTNDTYVHVSCM